MTDKEQCPGCGVVLQVKDNVTHQYLGCSASCWEQFGILCAKEYSNPEYMKFHRLTVDSYCAQHVGEENQQTLQSINLHLAALFWCFEDKLSLQHITKLMAVLKNNYKDKFQWYQPPSFENSMNITDVLKAQNAQEHCDLVYQWAENIWSYWKAYHSNIATLTASVKIY